MGKQERSGTAWIVVNIYFNYSYYGTYRTRKEEAYIAQQIWMKLFFLFTFGVNTVHAIIKLKPKYE